MIVEWARQPDSIKVFVVICVVLEGLAMLGLLIGSGFGIRNTLVAVGGFWPDFLEGQTPLVPGQPIYMFASSAFVHGGLSHLFMNMLALLWLGPIVVQRLGESAFWPIAGLSALGAGGLYAAMTNTGAPMVGASGVLFGLLGLVAVWTVLDTLKRRRDLGPLFGHAAAFLALNVALTVLSNGAIAWQAHLGGFVAGMLCGPYTWKSSVTR